MNAAGIAKALGGRRSGSGFVAKCPAHEDRSPSLSISDAENGIVLIHCFAGCSQAAVIDALGRLGLWSDHSESNVSRNTRPVPKPRRDDATERIAKARHLWRRRRPIEGTLAEIYLRKHRRIKCALPST